jgi:hypothetical protein
METLVAWIMIDYAVFDCVPVDVGNVGLRKGQVNHYGLFPRIWTVEDFFDSDVDFSPYSVIDFASTKDSCVVFDLRNHVFAYLTLVENDHVEEGYIVPGELEAVQDALEIYLAALMP